jgi:hypothetical protein
LDQNFNSNCHGGSSNQFCDGECQYSLKTGRKQFKVNKEALARIESMMGEFEEYRGMVKQKESNLADGDAHPGM